ncbi:MAG: S-layer homology domain-containing protein [Clostridia bacterium]|nr:S-layer homology domain-containing protein [Clostridia bacterium]
MKKYIFVFTFLLLCLMSLSASGQDDFLYSFENPQDAQMWDGGEIDDGNQFDLGYSIFVSNPFGEIRNEKITHVLDYSPTIKLEGGKVYTLSGMVFNPLASSDPSIRTSASRYPRSNTIIISVSGIGDSWAEFTTTFFADESGEYNLSIHFGGGFADFGIFADEISLTKTPCILSSLNITGADEITIPAEGSITNYYRPYIITSENKTVDILTSSNLHFSLSDAVGISFDNENFALTTSSEALPDTQIVLNCTLKNYEFLTPASFKINLKSNMLKDDFKDLSDIPWHSLSDIKVILEDGHPVISVPMNDYGDFGYFSKIIYNEQLVLIEDIMYVIRARVKTDNPYVLPAIYATNSSEMKNSMVNFSIKDISGSEWNDVFIAFIPEASGIYTISLDLCSTYDCTIFIEDISLTAETSKPEYITLHAPGNIALPNEFVSYPVTALLRDQAGNILPSEDVQVTLLEQNDHLEFDSEKNLITVHPDSPVGVYTLYARYLNDPTVSGKLNFTVSYDYIGDGTFEKTVPNQWWMTSSSYECDLYMRYDGQSRRALINCSGGYFMLLNNSYVHLSEGTPYVFNSAFSTPVDAFATLFLEKLDSSVMPLCQVFIPSGTTLEEASSPELFLAEEDMVGRLFLYIESTEGESFSIYADNLSLKKASIIAVSPRVTGIPYINGAVEAQFTLYNNIAENSDKSACAVSWFVSDTQNGEYTDVSTSGSSIYFDTTFLNKYVYFEVTPICPITGFSGNTIRSLPFIVTYDPAENSSDLPMYTPALKDNSSSESYFSDTQNHWSREYVDILAYSGIANGKSNDTFAPDSPVTRGEFSKLLAETFSINTVSNIFTFADVPQSSWYYRYINSLYLAGIVSGVSDNMFLPDNPISREEAAVMIMRLFDRATNDKVRNTDIHFSDVQSISPWALEAVKKAVSLDIIKGTPEACFYPKNLLTRGESAALICRLAEKLG